VRTDVVPSSKPSPTQCVTTAAPVGEEDASSAPSMSDAASSVSSVCSRLVDNFEVRQEAVRDSLALLHEMGFPDRPVLHTSLILLHSGNINRVVQSLFAVEASEEHTREVIERARTQSNTVFEKLHCEAGHLGEQASEQVGQLGKMANEQMLHLSAGTATAATALERQIGTAQQCLRDQLQRYQEQEQVRTAQRRAASAAATVEHHALCDHCHAVIRGARYKCLTCADFDLCACCETVPGVHHADHLLVKILRPDQLESNRSRLESLGLQCVAAATTAVEPVAVVASAEPVVDVVAPAEPVVAVATPVVVPAAPVVAVAEPSLMERLHAMGFEDEEANRTALQQASGDLHQSCILLLK
jgi:Zinc finger, ZZ type